MASCVSRLITTIVRPSAAMIVLTVTVGCASITRGHVGAQVQSRYPYSADVALPRPFAKWRWVRRVTNLAVSELQHEIERRQNNDMDHRTTQVEALSIWLPGAPVIR